MAPVLHRCRYKPVEDNKQSGGHTGSALQRVLQIRTIQIEFMQTGTHRDTESESETERET